MFLAIPSVLYLLEIQVFKREMNLDDASCLDSCSQNILLCWLVILGSESVQIVKETKNISFIFGKFYFARFHDVTKFEICRCKYKLVFLLQNTL